MTAFAETGLVVAPLGRDAKIAASMLAEADISAKICVNLAELADELRGGAGFAIITEEAMAGDLRDVAAWLDGQPEWSDFPFILLTRRGGGIERNPAASRYLKTLGNVTFLERPFHPTTLISLAEAALRGRRRQYEARARLELLRENERELEARVEQRTAEREAAQDALRQAQKMEAIGQLTGGVAHDFNNLLTVIRGSVELLQRDGLPEAKRATYLEAIRTTADRAAKLTGQLLAFARRQSLNPELFDVGASIDSSANIVRTLIGSRIALDLRFDDGLTIRADRAQFETAIVNMAINARDAMDGEGRLTISATAVDAIPAGPSEAASEGDYVAIAIADTGSGISAEDAKRIFEPFFTTKKVGQGTGLGLSQVIGFAKQSGGDVRVRSTLGQGATFTLYLPQNRDAAHSGRADAPPRSSQDGRGVCVLVVEDNEQVGAFATQALRELGYTSALALNAKEALLRLRDHPDHFDIVFSDVVMPEMSGVELARELDKLAIKVPIVLASGYSQVLAQSGASGVELLHKPYTIQQLSTVLSKALACKRA